MTCFIDERGLSLEKLSDLAEKCQEMTAGEIKRVLKMKSCEPSNFITGPLKGGLGHGLFLRRRKPEPSRNVYRYYIEDTTAPYTPLHPQPSEQNGHENVRNVYYVHRGSWKHVSKVDVNDVDRVVIETFRETGETQFSVVGPSGFEIKKISITVE